MRIATSMTSLRVNVLETVLVPLITELLRLAKEHSAPALITNSIFPTNLQTTFFLIGTRVCIHRSRKKFARHLCALSKDDLYVCIAIFQAKRQHRYRNPGGGEYETVEERRAAMIAKGWSPTVLAAMEEAMEPKFLNSPFRSSFPTSEFPRSPQASAAPWRRSCRQPWFAWRPWPWTPLAEHYATIEGCVAGGS